MKKSTLQVRLNRRVTFDRRIEFPSPSFFFKIKNEEKNSFADWIIELANRGFGMSRDAFLTWSVKKFLDKEVRIMLLNNRSRSPPYPSHLLWFISRCKVIFLESIADYLASGLNRFSLGQISELLRSKKESYCNVKLKCPDTGQHTVRSERKDLRREHAPSKFFFFLI